MIAQWGRATWLNNYLSDGILPLDGLRLLIEEDDRDTKALD